MNLRVIPAFGLLCLLAPFAAQASFTYQFNGTYSPYSVSISFTTSLSNVDGLSSDNITPTVSGFNETNNIPGVGSAALSIILSTNGSGVPTAFTITNTNGDIVTATSDTGPSTPAGFVAPPEDEAGFALGETSDSGGVLFGSYPAFAGENPDDFFCTYNDSNGALITDNDAGFCFSTAVSEGSSPGTSVVGSGTCHGVFSPA